MSELPQSTRVSRYKPDISLGNILTMASMLGGILLVGVGVIIWGLRLESRVDSEQQVGILRQQNNDLRFQHIDGRIAEQKAATDSIVTDIKDALRRIENKLDNKADKAR